MFCKFHLNLKSNNLQYHTCLYCAAHISNRSVKTNFILKKKLTIKLLLCCISDFKAACPPLGSTSWFRFHRLSLSPTRQSCRSLTSELTFPEHCPPRTVHARLLQPQRGKRPYHPGPSQPWHAWKKDFCPSGSSLASQGDASLPAVDTSPGAFSRPWPGGGSLLDLNLLARGPAHFQP